MAKTPVWNPSRLAILDTLWWFAEEYFSLDSSDSKQEKQRQKLKANFKNTLGHIFQAMNHLQAMDEKWSKLFVKEGITPPSSEEKRVITNE